jgi:hypothetical protein
MISLNKRYKESKNKKNPVPYDCDSNATISNRIALYIARVCIGFDRGDYLCEYLQRVISFLKLDTGKRNSWGYHLDRLSNFFLCGIEGKDKAPFSVIKANGNKKLPFFAFSSLPIIDCPGAGACKRFCYSFKAWRYPAAYCRQLQNSYLIRYAFGYIEEAFKALPQNAKFRLYVDGDFDSLQTLRQWMDLIKTRPDVRVYGYSKSWQLFLELHASGYQWPSNYLLNLSSGSKYNEKSGIARAVKELPIVREKFIAVKVSSNWIESRAYQDKTREGSARYRLEVAQNAKKEYGARVFACPGNCGNCLPNGEHACGSDKMRGIPIAIGIHG